MIRGRATFVGVLVAVLAASLVTAAPSVAAHGRVDACGAAARGEDRPRSGVRGRFDLRRGRPRLRPRRELRLRLLVLGECAGLPPGQQHVDDGRFDADRAGRSGAGARGRRPDLCDRRLRRRRRDAHRRGVRPGDRQVVGLDAAARPAAEPGCGDRRRRQDLRLRLAQRQLRAGVHRDLQPGDQDLDVRAGQPVRDRRVRRRPRSGRPHLCDRIRLHRGLRPGDEELDEASRPVPVRQPAGGRARLLGRRPAVRGGRRAEVRDGLRRRVHQEPQPLGRRPLAAAFPHRAGGRPRPRWDDLRDRRLQRRLRDDPALGRAAGRVRHHRADGDDGAHAIPRRGYDGRGRDRARQRCMERQRRLVRQRSPAEQRRSAVPDDGVRRPAVLAGRRQAVAAPAADRRQLPLPDRAERCGREHRHRGRRAGLAGRSRAGQQRVAAVRRRLGAGLLAQGVRR